MLSYLWNFDDYMPTRWGVKNLEFMLMLANDLATSDMEDHYPIDDLFSILLEPKPFSTVMRSLPSISQAMEFIEDHIIKNAAIDHNLKLQLLYSPEMAPFSFLGALYHLSMNTNNTQADENDDRHTDSKRQTLSETVEEVLSMFEMLTKDDVLLIIKNELCI
jgi:hypothetical protein